MLCVHRVRLVLSFSVAGLAVTLWADQQREQAARQTAQSDAATRIDLNTADAADLAALPAIGAELAAAIVSARPFTSVDDLNRVNGISTEQLELIRAKVTVVPPASARGAAPQPAASLSALEKPKVNLNTADARTLESVAGIGPEVARAIMAARPLASVDELSEVAGITAEQLEQIRAQVIVSGPSTPKKKEASSPPVRRR